MTPSDIQSAIELEVAKRWPDFQRLHPALAAELEQPDYIAASLESLRRDIAYRDALRKGELANKAADWLSHLAERVVRSVMQV